MGARADEVVFTSGGTEADNLAVLGAWRARAGRRRRAVESTRRAHRRCSRPSRHAAAEGAAERLLRIDRRRRGRPGVGRRDVRRRRAVCSVMWVNNETGVVQPVPALAERARARGVVMHTDAVQAFGRLPVDVRATPVDLLTISGHKLGAPKGVGALYVRRGTALAPLFHGGAQDRGRRPGTENVAYAVGLATAAELAVAEREAECARLVALRDALEAAILGGAPDAVIHGRGAARAPHVTSVSVPGVDGASLLLALDLHGVAVSGGSACQTGKAEPSHVLLAMGVEPALASGAVRLSVGALTTPACVARAGALLPRLAAKARAVAAAGASW
jgi:cysteine desulfurase